MENWLFFYLFLPKKHYRYWYYQSFLKIYNFYDILGYHFWFARWILISTVTIFGIWRISQLRIGEIVFEDITWKIVFIRDAPWEASAVSFSSKYEPGEKCKRFSPFRFSSHSLTCSLSLFRFFFLFLILGAVYQYLFFSFSFFENNFHSELIQL